MSVGDLHVGPNRYSIVLRSLVGFLFGGVVLSLAYLSLISGGSDGYILLGVAALCTALVLWPALRGLFTWPVRAHLLPEKGVLVTRTLLSKETATELSAILGMERTSFWQGGRVMCNGLVLNLSEERSITLSACSLATVEGLFNALLALGIADLGSDHGSGKQKRPTTSGQ